MDVLPLIVVLALATAAGGAMWAYHIYASSNLKSDIEDFRL